MIDLSLNPPMDWHYAYIPKKDGTKRQLIIPNEELKQVQKGILETLYMHKEIKATWWAHGFAPYKGIVTGAMMHDKEAPLIINVDVHHFFPSFPVSKIRDELMKSTLSPAEIAYIMKYCVYTHEDGRQECPQGAPTSPYLTNIGMRPLDRMLAKYAEKRGYTFSRYADDITFAADVSNPLYNPDVKSHRFIINGIKAVLSLYGLILSEEKTSLVYRNSPRAARRVTGINLRQDGKGYNARRPTRQKARNLVHILYSKLKQGIPTESLNAEFWRVRGVVEFCDYVRKHSDEGYNDKDHRVDSKKYNYILMRFGQDVRTE